MLSCRDDCSCFPSIVICLMNNFSWKAQDNKGGLPLNKSRWFGVRGWRSLGSSDVLVMGRSFNIASIWQRSVFGPSSSTFCWWRTVISTLLTIWIMSPHGPPCLEAEGMLKLQTEARSEFSNGSDWTELVLMCPYAQLWLCNLVHHMG